VEANISLESLGQITGKVTDVKSGNPIEGARVRAFSENRAHKRAFTAVTDKDGLYELTHLPEGEYIIRANAMDYLGEFYENTTDPKEATLVQVENTKSTPDIDFELQKGSIIKGQVTDAITTEPLSDVYVTVRHQDKRFHRTTKTDETGCFELTGLPSGSFFAMAKARNYNVQWYSEAEIKAEATVIELVEDEIKEGIDFRLSEKVQEGAIVSGTVTDDSTDLTIEGATVAVMPLTFARPIRAISGPDGTYELKGLQPGVYLIICRAPGYVAEYYKDAYRWVHAEKIRIHGTENITGIDFSLAPQPEGAYMVSGRVANDQGQSMEGVYIVAEAQDQVIAATTTDSEGEYILNDLPVGEYKITASVSGYPESSSTSQEIQIGNGMQTGTVDIYMPSTPTGVEKNILPNAYKLEQNYPNPFNPTTEIKFILPETAQLKLIIYNILGKPVKTLYDGQHKAGTFAIQWTGRDDQGKKLASGVYIYKMIAQAQGETFIKSYQMLMLK
jgi:5-hydroxyisourate hydrolase-like protein (transthyretin family)